ncbi:hypothetical protein G3O08_20065 [Cryomorpha ignava]|uniref:Histidine kinase domain-containing protein n=1 Tax=Cryomorpha ignava TaxID=101383 RepID=A0A7K3WW57_9FLAO|nr:7TM diverse intracellular signaling domain-containing protein [Cryomorpha ignava]NEN25788.1 hypothetical protein [Cryomorpha ignava]
MAINRIQWILFFILSLANSFVGYAAPFIGDSIIKLEINEEQFLLDPNNEFSYDDVRNKAFNASKEDAENLLSKLNPNRSVWTKLNVKNHSNKIYIGVIYSNPCTEKIYCWEENGILIKKKIGFLLPNKDDIIFFDRYLLPITLNPGETRTYYIKTTEYVRYISSGSLNTFVGTKNDFNAIKRPIGSSNLVNLHVFFNGFLIFQLFYIMLQWFLVRRIEYFYYVLYLLSLFAYFWPRHVISTLSFEGIEIFISHFVANFNDILLVLPAFFYLRFIRHFLDMAVHKPIWNKIIRYFEYLFLLLSVLILFTNTLIPNDLPKSVLILSCVGIQFVLSLLAIRGFYAVKTRLARFAITAGAIVITAHLAAMAISVFNLYNYIDIAPIAITMVAIIIEIAIFNSGLLFKARQFEKDKFKAQTVLLNELEDKQKLQLEYEGVRDKISRDLHDDVGSTLSSVSIYSYAAKDKLAKGDLTQTRELLLSIEKNALSTLNSMGDLVWAINPQNDSTEKLLERISTFGYSILAVNDCKFDMEIDPEFYNHRLNLEERRSILLICKEALNNAAKYAKADDICLKIYKHGQNFRLELSDNGKGFDIDKTSYGNGLKSMETRARILSTFFEIKSDQKGTTIKFDIE